MTIKGEVLIIDDDADLCDALESALQEDGFAVRCAHQGTRGLALMREKKPDLVFLDVMMRMPTEGLWVAEEMCKDRQLRDVALVLLTSIVDSEYAGHFPTDCQLRCHMFLDKPVPLSKILEVANQLVGRPASALS